MEGIIDLHHDVMFVRQLVVRFSGNLRLILYNYGSNLLTGNGKQLLKDKSMQSVKELWSRVVSEISVKNCKKSMTWEEWPQNIVKPISASASHVSGRYENLLSKAEFILIAYRATLRLAKDVSIFSVKSHVSRLLQKCNKIQSS